MIDISNRILPIITIYKNPKDYPNLYVARLFEKCEPTSIVKTNKKLTELLKEIPKSMTKIEREEYDDPVIICTYL